MLTVYSPRGTSLNQGGDGSRDGKLTAWQNAGHIAQAVRPDTYHALTDTSSYHLVAIDYRGFGHSTGIPSEDGLIQDASALVEWALNVAGLPPSRIVLIGHSLGTAVVSGVAERYAVKGIEFAGIILVAGFSNLASLLSGYRMGGLIPVLGPFAAWPQLVRLLDRFVVDKWHSADRLANIVRHTKTRLRLSLIHAKNDRDIPCAEDDKLFRAAANETVGILDDEEFAAWKEERTVRKGKDAFVTTWTAAPDMMIRQELFPYGGERSAMTLPWLRSDQSPSCSARSHRGLRPRHAGRDEVLRLPRDGVRMRRIADHAATAQILRVDSATEGSSPEVVRHRAIVCHERTENHVA